ncbi:sulfatase [Rubripirellula reticaptiva]|uniref:Choline-sulfatase n=1 Tax=Rubripirellula reticaptiva TaxID=2528013 RepID=A0A5C6EUJ4_9BACT|nr:sulfatase [Rubripirellula reticaptiva]TWU51970.1 Choline-sulfatase [Rubripirellula reticaptiva]
MIRFIVVFASLFGIVSIADASERPNVVFVAIDDLNDWVGCLGGHPQVQTPCIDRLAARGVNFTNAHCQAPICNPSRISMLLGKLPSTTGHYFLAPGFRDVDVTRDDVTLFQYFRSQGYRTESMGKVFHSGSDEASFDHVERSQGYRRAKGQTEKLRYRLPGSHPGWDWGEFPMADKDQRDHYTAAWAAKRIPELAEQEQPFCMAIGFHLPHVPIYATKKWFDMYPLATLQMPKSPADDLDDVPPIAVQLSLNPTAPRHQWMTETGEDKHAVQAYLASISFVDHLVGMVTDSIENAGLGDNTMVVLFSDHGFHLGEKNKWAKRSLWLRTTRVPLIISGPGFSKNQLCNSPVGLIDVYPTLVQACGLPMPDGLDGNSLVGLMKDTASPWDHPAICTFGPGNHSVQSRDYHYIRYQDGAEELYDHRTDKDELHNLIGDETLEPISARHRAWVPVDDAPMVPGSRGSDSPLYGESEGLLEAMNRNE